MTFAEDISLFFGDLAVSAVIVVGTSTSTAACYFDRPSQTMLANAALTDDVSCLMATSSAPGLARGSSLTIGSNGYTVRQVELQDDGLVQRVYLVAA
jgi:hypothetical protein